MRAKSTMAVALSIAAPITLLFVAAQSTAQHERPSALHVAARVQAFYEQTRTFRADFRQVHRHRIQGRTRVSNGEVAVARPGRIRFDYASSGRTVLSDGEHVTVYEPPESGSRGQYSQVPARGDITSALGLLTGDARLDRDFRFRLRNAEALGFTQGDVLELRPRRPNPAYRRLLLYVSRGRTAGMVRSIVIYDHDRNINRFDFRNPRFNAQISNHRFQFRPPSGARRVLTPRGS